MAELEANRVNKPTESTPLFKNPVFLTAVFGAIVAAFANAWIAFINNNTLVSLEVSKEAQEQLMESKKAEYTRILEISKMEIEPARSKIKAFCGMGLITDPAICSSNVILANKEPSPQTGLPQNKNNYFDPATWDSDWVGGGHNQEEMCNNGLVALKANDLYKDKTLTVVSASQDFRKSFFGHVEYKYNCVYRVSRF